MAKRGRPKATEEAAHRNQVITAAIAELVEKGYEKTTMLGIAKRAGSSKETLYAWFGNKQGLLAALIKFQAEQTALRLNTALDNSAEPRATLIGFANGLLRLLLGEPSVTLNRAAMISPALAAVLLEHGRHTAGPIAETYLARLQEEGYLEIDSPADAFQLLYGLIIQDWQIRVLLGETAPTEAELSAHAVQAVDRFLHLCSADS